MQVVHKNVFSDVPDDVSDVALADDSNTSLCSTDELSKTAKFLEEETLRQINEDLGEILWYAREKCKAD